MSLGFKIYSLFNGKLVYQDSLGNKYYHDKKNSLKRWVVYAQGFGPESLPTQFHNWLHNTFKIDDPVGAISVHGVAGIWGVVAMGLFASGYPASGDIPPTSFGGQLVGCIVMFLVGFVPGYGISFIMKAMGWLRVPDAVQKAGIDQAELGLKAYQ